MFLEAEAEATLVVALVVPVMAVEEAAPAVEEAAQASVTQRSVPQLRILKAMPALLQAVRSLFNIPMRHLHKLLYRFQEM
jgi:hypothetical protein